MIDLHVHSTFSDGSYTPEKIVEMAVDAGLTAIALTDHDTTAGTARFLAACEEEGMRGVPGVEISANAVKGTLHILGYYVDKEDPEFESVLAKIRQGRAGRNDTIIKNLGKLGFDLTMEEVAAFAGEDVVGRPHFAQAMMKRGYVKDKQEAFDKYLAKGKPGYAERYRMSDSESIAEILRVGGVPVLAHPFTLELDAGALDKYVGDLVDMGLQGIEVYYSEHNKAQVDQYLALTEKYDIAATGGSDFHGEVNPKVKLGRGFGNLRVEDALLDRLEAMKR